MEPMLNQGPYSSVDEDKKTRDRWNGVHRVHHPGALSGSDPLIVLQQHLVAHMIRSGLVTLDIGVGLGGMSRHLHSQGCVVDALDVADTAEETVREYIRNFYVADDIITLPNNEYNLAISNIVAQHMNEKNLRDQIQHVFRALKPGGLFSLHMAGATESHLSNITGPIPKGMDGAMCRDPEYALAMIDDVIKTGYNARMLAHQMAWPQYKSYWYFIHITKET